MWWERDAELGRSRGLRGPERHRGPDSQCDFDPEPVPRAHRYPVTDPERARDRR